VKPAIMPSRLLSLNGEPESWSPPTSDEELLEDSRPLEYYVAEQRGDRREFQMYLARDTKRATSFRTQSTPGPDGVFPLKAAKNRRRLRTRIIQSGAAIFKVTEKGNL
jgi:hypothetical protein